MSLVERLEEMVEERLMGGEPIEAESAGVTCQCGWEIEVPWALREQLDAKMLEHNETAHPGTIARFADEDDDLDEDDDDDFDEDDVDEDDEDDEDL